LCFFIGSELNLPSVKTNARPNVEQLLSTKLYIPSTRSQLVSRPHLIQQLDESLHCKLALISAPAGFGKTTLVSTWVTQKLEGDGTKKEAGKTAHSYKAAWLSLDPGDSDPARFLTYLIAALQTIAPNFGEGLLGALQSPQLPPIESILTSLVNEIAAMPEHFILVLDDYHVIDSGPVDEALAFLIENQPQQMSVIIATREDPDLPLARLRARGQLTELRAADLRFTPSEAAQFLNQVMKLHLSPENIAALEARTEGWIAGLQLAALSMQGDQDSKNFIQSFTGSHRFVLDYLMEEVLARQPERVQTFLLRTSILERMCGPLCDAVLLDPSIPGQETLERLERANLFIVPLDNKRRWYRYHHLFADLLRQRLQQSSASAGNGEGFVNELHLRASQWYEDNGLELEAFQHAAAGNDIERAERLIDGTRIPLHFSGGVTPILEWLESLPTEVKNTRPSLWWRHAAMLLINGQTIGVGENLQAAEAALARILQGAEPDEQTRNLIGQIAAASATLALTRYDVEGMLTQSRRALEYLHPQNLFTRATANWSLGFAHTLLGDRAAARQAFTEGISLSQKIGAVFSAILSMIGLGTIQEADNQLRQAAETYRHILQLAGDHPQQIIGEAHLGLARVFYEWNDLDAAEQHTEQSLRLARQYESFIDRFIIAEVFLARLKLAQGDVEAAAALLVETDRSVREHNFVYRMPEVAAAQVLVFLSQGDLAAAAHLAQTHNLPTSQARVLLVQGDPSAALAVLGSWRRQVEEKGWKDEQLKAMILQALTYYARGDHTEALQTLADALALAEPGGFIRIFVDEGLSMARLLSEAAAQGIMPGYVNILLAAFEEETKSSSPAQSLIETLSPRELEVLQLIAQGLTNDEIGKRLFLALDTVKGHNRRIFDKLQVQRRTEAVARARELGLL
jgi:LuxR family maltose regulon positive regulatory protein